MNCEGDSPDVKKLLTLKMHAIPFKSTPGMDYSARIFYNYISTAKKTYPSIRRLSGMTRTIFMIFASLVLCSCAANKSDSRLAQSDLKLDSDRVPVVCTREYPTGSHLPTKVCRSQRQIETDREKARNYIDRIKTLPTAPGSSG